MKSPVFFIFIFLLKHFFIVFSSFLVIWVVITVLCWGCFQKMFRELLGDMN